MWRVKSAISPDVAAPATADRVPKATVTYRAQQAVTALFVFGPLVALGFALVHFWNRGISALDVALTVGFYVVVGHGVSVGFHRLFAHRSFRAARGLKVALAVAGSMAFEGSLIAWVSNHRLHHAHADKDGDPHSPALNGSGFRHQLAGLWHAHMGWFFRPAATCQRKFGSDLAADADLRVVNRLFPVWCVLSLALPFGLGWVLGGRLAAAATALLWAGAVRIFVLHHVTWSINSVCHTFGRRPFRTDDRSTNVPALSLLSFGESWHNAHHAFPAMARHGVDHHQLDSSAALIRLCERVGWARMVRWPDVARLDGRRYAALDRVG
jgi:stearoyl-CoA desaturase (delta-9 desaturase)